MTAQLIREVPVDTTEDVTTARQVVAQARADSTSAVVNYTLLLDIESLTERLTQKQGELDTARQEWADWVTNAVERSHEVSREEDWCEVFDDAMESLGLPRRESPTESVNWWTTVTLEVEVSEDDIISAVVSQLDDGPNKSDVSVNSNVYAQVEVEVRGTLYDQPEGDCCCGNVDTDDIRAALPDWAEYTSIESEGTTYCDNCN